MSLAISGDTIAYLMGLGLSGDQMKGLIDRLQKDALELSPKLPASNEERERIRNESTYAERKRAKDRERQRRIREEARQSRDIDGDPRDNRATSTATEGDKAATVGDEPATPRARVRDISPRLVISGSDDAVVERERVPTDDWPKTGNLVRLLVEAAESPWLDLAKSPDLTTTGGRLAAWKREGASWEHDVVPVVRAVCAKRRGRISSWKYFDGAVAQSIADNRAALEIPEAAVSGRGQGPPLVSQIASEHAEARRRALES